MIAAIYARKSTEQNGVGEEEKSITRQIEHAKMYAAGKGWSVAEEHIYVDDGISGAEFTRRPGFLRLMNSLKPTPPFQVLIMSEESRLGRESIETAFALKQLVTAGVRVFFYLEDRERLLTSPTDKIMLSLTTFADELERSKAQQRTYDAMVRKARAGQVTGGRVFGYDNVDIVGPPGPDGKPKRLHVDRRINEPEATIVRDIFKLYAEGDGFKAIAERLNEQHAPCPRPRPDTRVHGWAPSSVRAALLRPLYRGEIIWNQTKKRDSWGQRRARRRPASEWLRVEAPSLRMIPESLWQAAQERLTSVRASYLRGTDGQLWGRPANGIESKYLLTGLLECTVCKPRPDAHGGSFCTVSRSHGKQRAFFYACTTNRLRGKCSCSNTHWLPMEAADTEILTRVLQDVLQPEVAAESVRKALRQLSPNKATLAEKRRALEVDLTGAESEVRNLTAAIATGGQLPALLDGLQEREQRVQRLRTELDKLDQAGRLAQFDQAALRRTLLARVQDWDYLRAQLTGHVTIARQLLRKLLVGRLQLTPKKIEGEWVYEYTGQATLGRLLAGFLSAKGMASPTGFEPVLPP